MILRHDIMANGVNPDSSQIQMSSLVNRRLKLPPIATSYNGKNNINRSSHENIDFNSSQDLNLPRIDFSSLGFENTTNSTQTSVNVSSDFSAFSFPRVYTVLPPIGKTFIPSESATVNIPKAPSSVRKQNRSTRRPRIKKQKQTSEKRNVEGNGTKDINVSKSQTFVDNEHIIKTPVAISTNIRSESISIDIPEPEPPTGEEKCDENKHTSNSIIPEHLKSFKGKKNDEKGLALRPDAIYTSISEPGTNDNAYSDNERNSESPFPQFSTVPESLRLYSEVYPPSPPPSEKKAKIAVDKTRQLLIEENRYRLSYLEDYGNQRRNATCGELDDTLTNAVQLLKELFLRKTMEELCMLW